MDRFVIAREQQNINPKAMDEDENENETSTNKKYNVFVCKYRIAGTKFGRVFSPLVVHDPITQRYLDRYAIQTSDASIVSNRSCLMQET